MTESAVLPAVGRLPSRLVGETTYRLVRAWPRSVDHMLLELQRHDGREATETVVGQTFSELGTSWTPSQTYRAWERAGRDIADLHAADVDLVEDRHDDEAEVAGSDRWLAPAVAHDRQLLRRPDGRIGLIDVDMLAVGERAVTSPTSWSISSCGGPRVCSPPRRQRRPGDGSGTACSPVRPSTVTQG